VFDAETGTHYNYFRDYDPQTGRYIQSDPIGLEGGINTYGYVEGRPNLLVDPTGRSSLALPGVVGAGAGAAEGAGMASNPVGWVAAAGLGGYVAGSMISDAYRPQINDAVDWVFGDPMAAAQGNVADTQIEQDYGREASECKLGGKKPEDKCEWLERNASRYSPARVKATQKAWGCRGSRHGKGGKGR
jgi:RHS repeat-associated protein